MTDRLLALVRHGESEGNLADVLTGRTDVDLTAAGVQQAREAGRRLKQFGFRIDAGFTSTLKRARHTLALVLDELGQTGSTVVTDARLDERDYGEITGMTRAGAIRRWGEAQVHAWRRSYGARPPGGESLKDTAARVLPCYLQEILPRVLRGEGVLVAAHGNCLRALVMVLERLDETAVAQRELATGAPLIVRLNADSTVAETIELAR
jgi:2,3-bisphosphoglycerate-dependent phosphoglycerate mutase